MDFTTIGQAKKQTGLSYLGGVNISSKLTKNMKVNVMTYCIYLSPAHTSGYDVCPESTFECRLGCLATSGRAAMDIASGQNIIRNARIKKTELFFEENEFFMGWLVAEMTAAKAKADRTGFVFSARLNGTSDIDWSKAMYKGQNIFEIFPDTQFYDYTKMSDKFEEIAPNYSLTYSYTGYNWAMCMRLMDKGHNIAMIFNVKDEKYLPAMYKGYNVINGDLNDYRIADAKGIIVGLKWKRIQNKAAEKKVLNSVFVVNVAGLEPMYTVIPK
jgi:hypothetical protein